MQTYLHYGWGCPGHVLTEEEAWRIVTAPHKKDPQLGIGLGFESFTEDYEGPNWGTVVVRDFGETGMAGKLITAAQMQELLLTHGTIPPENQGSIRDQLAQVGLERLMDHLSLVMFHSNY